MKNVTEASARVHKPASKQPSLSMVFTRKWEEEGDAVAIYLGPSNLSLQNKVDK